MKLLIRSTLLLSSLAAAAPALAEAVIAPGAEASFATADGHSPPISVTQFGAQCLAFYDETAGNMMSAVFGALPNARGSCVVAEYNDFSIAGDGFDSALLTQISGRVEANGFIGLVGMGQIKSEVLVEVVDRGDDLDVEDDDVILMTHPVFVHELLQGIDAGVGIGGSLDLGSLTALQGGIELGVDFGIPLGAKVIREKTDFGFQVLLQRGRSYRVRTVAQVNFKLGVAGGFAIGSFHSNRATLENLFQPEYWLQTSALPIAAVDIGTVTFPLAQVETLFTIPEIKFPGWSVTIDWFISDTTFTIIPETQILPATEIPNPLPYANPAALLQALGLFGNIVDFVGSPLVGLAKPFGSEDAITDIGTRVHQLDVVVEHDLLEEEIRFLVERNLAYEGKKNPVASFQLPAALGGQLELAREIVAARMAAITAAGLSTGKATKHIAAGDEKFAAGMYKAAFQRYRKAYVAMTE